MKKISLLLATTMQFFVWSQEWVGIYKDSSISIQYAKITYESVSDGINHERLIFNYENLTNQDKTFEISRKVAYDGIALPQTNERKYAITIPAFSIKSYSEIEERNKLYYIFVADNKGTIKKRMSGFEIVNVELK